MVCDSLLITSLLQVVNRLAASCLTKLVMNRLAAGCFNNCNKSASDKSCNKPAILSTCNKSVAFLAVYTYSTVLVTRLDVCILG